MVLVFVVLLSDVDLVQYRDGEVVVRGRQRLMNYSVLATVFREAWHENKLRGSLPRVPGASMRPHGVLFLRSRNKLRTATHSTILPTCSLDLMRLQYRIYRS